DKRVFQKIFKIAEMSKMTEEERELYHSDVKAKSDWNAGIRFAEKKAAEKGLKEGLKKGVKEGLKKGEFKKAVDVARLLKIKAIPIKDISEVTGLSVEEVELL
ncbi:MAG: hypothetical protein EOO90_08395, partial [Pedobacter sp.]